MRKRRYINNFANLYACTVYGANSSLTTVARSLNVGFHLTESEIKSCFGTILRSCLSCIRSIFL